MLTLRLPRPVDEISFRSAHREFTKEDSNHPFAFAFDENQDFSDYVRRVEHWAKGQDLPADFVPNTFLVGIVGGMVVGRLSIRHELNDWLARVGGHIGYAVIPSQRRKGYATDMLRQGLPVARSLGIQRALLTCDDNNLASYRVIEANGGIFERLVWEPGMSVPKRRYWIPIS